MPWVGWTVTRMPSERSTWGEHAGEGVLRVDDQRGAAHSAGLRLPARRSRSASQNRDKPLVAGQQRGAHRRVGGQLLDVGVGVGGGRGAIQSPAQWH